MTESSPPLTRVLASRDKQRPQSLSSCSLNVLRQSPPVKFHTFTNPSDAEEMIWWPFGSHSKRRTEVRCPSRFCKIENSQLIFRFIFSASFWWITTGRQQQLKRLCVQFASIDCDLEFHWRCFFIKKSYLIKTFARKILYCNINVWTLFLLIRY